MKREEFYRLIRNPATFCLITCCSSDPLIEAQLLATDKSTGRAKPAAWAEYSEVSKNVGNDEPVS